MAWCPPGDKPLFEPMMVRLQTHICVTRSQQVNYQSRTHTRQEHGHDFWHADTLVHPCEKVIGIFFQNQIWSRLLDINRLCLICIKRSIEEVKMCQIYKRGYQKGPSDETLKKARYQFCDVKFGHRITVAMGLFDYKMCNLPQFPLISQTGEARVLFHDLLVLFCINDIFVNYTQLK